MRLQISFSERKFIFRSKVRGKEHDCLGADIPKLGIMIALLGFSVRADNNDLSGIGVESRNRMCS